ncbi:hypothetical protein AB4K20DRAFT_1916097 [Rhizopus microsporus]
MSTSSKAISRSASAAPSGSRSLSFAAAPSATLSKAIPPNSRPTTGGNAKVQSSKSGASFVRVSLGATVGAAIIAAFTLM